MTASQIIAASAARTATETFEQEFNGSLTAQFIIDVTAGASATDTITITIDGYDVASGKWFNILTSAAITAVGTTVLRVGLDYANTANLRARDFLPKKYRIVATKNNGTSITYSIGSNLVM